MLCIMVLNSLFPETIDYRVGTGRMDFFDSPINQTRCVCIEIIDDAIYKGNRSFNLTLYSDHSFVRIVSECVSVFIIEDGKIVTYTNFKCVLPGSNCCLILLESDDFELRWINDSPRVSGDSVEADFSVGSGIVSLICYVTIEEPVDCELILTISTVCTSVVLPIWKTCSAIYSGVSMYSA